MSDYCEVGTCLQFQSNIRSINANIDKVRDVFVNCKELPDVLAFTETWLSDNSTIPEMDGYHFEGVNSTTTKNAAGGVGVYINNCIEYKIQKKTYH